MSQDPKLNTRSWISPLRLISRKLSAKVFAQLNNKVSLLEKKVFPREREREVAPWPHYFLMCMPHDVVRESIHMRVLVPFCPIRSICMPLVCVRLSQDPVDVHSQESPRKAIIKGRTRILSFINIIIETKYNSFK